MPKRKPLVPLFVLLPLLLSLAACVDRDITVTKPIPTRSVADRSTTIASPTSTRAAIALPTLAKTPDVTLPLEMFLVITPGQTSKVEVHKLLGDPDATYEESLSTCWDYQLDQTGTLLRVRFDLATHSHTVTWVGIENGQTIADLIDLFGKPAVVYLVDISEEGIGWYNRTFFAYPEIGVFAYVDSPPPELDDILIELYREPPTTLQEYLDAIEKRTDVKITHWP